MEELGWAGPAIEGAAGLIGGLFGLKAAAKKRQQEALMQGAQAKQQAEEKSAEMVGNQAPFQALMNSYGFLGKRGM